jgi:sialic acid synthase SpsE
VEGVVSNNKVKIIAEVAWAHDGDLDKAKMLVKNASLAAVDIINFHITDIPSYITKDYGNKDGLSVSKRGVSDIYKFLLDNNICVEDINKLLYLSKKFNLLTSVMINDSESFSRLDCSLVDYMCIAPAIVDEKSLIDNIHFAFNKFDNIRKVFVRCGASNFNEIKCIVNKFGGSNVVLLHGVQNFPSDVNSLNLNCLDTLSNSFVDCDVGLADHLDADSSLSLILPLMAISKGCNYIEKHITYSRFERGEDFESALELNELYKFVNYVRQAENALGSGDINSFSVSESKYNSVVRKRLVAKNKVCSGCVISADDVCFKRANAGFFIGDIDKVVGKIAVKDVYIDMSFDEESVGE